MLYVSMEDDSGNKGRFSRVVKAKKKKKES